MAPAPTTCCCELADTHMPLCPEQVPWCAVPSSDLHAGPAKTIDEHSTEPDCTTTISMVSSLLSTTYSSSILTQSSVRTSSSLHMPSSTPAGQQHGLDQHRHASTATTSTGSIMYSLDQLPTLTPVSPAPSPAPAPTAALAGRATRRIDADWSAVVANSVRPLKSLKLSSTATVQDAVDAPGSPPTSAHIRPSFVCPPAPKRPPPAFMLVPLSQLGSLAAA
jgi:hypothetical protein